MIRKCGRFRAVEVCQWIYVKLNMRLLHVVLNDHLTIAERAIRNL
jgi:hypothetical protein